MTRADKQLHELQARTFRYLLERLGPPHRLDAAESAEFYQLHAEWWKRHTTHKLARKDRQPKLRSKRRKQA
jgi:hypothetical protein